METFLEIQCSIHRKKIIWLKDTKFYELQFTMSSRLIPVHIGQDLQTRWTNRIKHQVWQCRFPYSQSVSSVPDSHCEELSSWSSSTSLKWPQCRVHTHKVTVAMISWATTSLVSLWKVHLCAIYTWYLTSLHNAMLCCWFFRLHFTIQKSTVNTTWSATDQSVLERCPYLNKC